VEHPRPAVINLMKTFIESHSFKDFVVVVVVVASDVIPVEASSSCLYHHDFILDFLEHWFLQYIPERHLVTLEGKTKVMYVM